EQATVIAMYFDPATQAPITLLELGLFARSGKLVVCCPAGYWRRGNVEVVCARYGVSLVEDLADLVRHVRVKLLA
ncbi:MAG: nucleoside 2-deoxyribosyltransferase domain-containing protein, partial [Planctomycetes bacterium]|nr:nucleoside 2-deoxyribosyltransferase domain-containing protein [Planctomycetota bacterium]